jgi:hypothetical protein
MICQYELNVIKQTDPRRYANIMYCRKHYADHKQAINAYQAKLRTVYAEQIKQYQREYYERNRDKLSAIRREWHKHNIEKSRGYVRKYQANRKARQECNLAEPMRKIS